MNLLTLNKGKTNRTNDFYLKSMYNRKTMKALDSPQLTHRSNRKLFTNNTNLISSIITERIKLINQIDKDKDKDKNKDNSITDPIEPKTDNIILSQMNNNRPASNYSNSLINPTLNCISLNQNFVDNLNNEISRYKLKTSRPPKYTKPKQLLSTYSSSHNSRPTSSAFFTTTIPLFSSNFLINTSPQNENRDKYQHYSNKLFQTNSKMPYIFKCINKKKFDDSIDNIYFQEVHNSNYLNRYKKSDANVEDILLFHNTFERTGYGKYSLPSAIKTKLNKKLKPKLDDYPLDNNRNKKFGVKWDSFRVSKGA